MKADRSGRITTGTDVARSTRVDQAQPDTPGRVTSDGSASCARDITSARRHAARRLLIVVACVVASFGSACGGVALSSTDPPELELIGDGVIRYRGPATWVVVEYQYAATAVGDTWLILDIGVTAVEDQAVSIDRNKVFVRTPEGRRVPLATQAEYGLAFAELRSRLRRANVLQNATYSFPATRRPCRFEFFNEPGQGITFDSVWVNDRRVCYERLLFDVPGGVVPGRWVLGIDLEESDIRIPFQLAGGPVAGDATR